MVAQLPQQKALAHDTRSFIQYKLVWQNMEAPNVAIVHLVL